MIFMLIGVMIFVSVLGIQRSGLDKGMPWFTFFSLFILYQAVLLLGGASDIVVDDECICRELYGWTWKKMRWDNISRIDAFTVFDRSRGINVMAYNIFPIVKSKIRLFPSGKIIFTDNFIGMELLLETINKYASKYDVKMQTKKDGKMTTVSQLK
jgi:hypothetical protein